MNQTLYGTPVPPPHHLGFRDGHTLALVIRRQYLHLEWVCPHQGVVFDSLETAPTCRIGFDEDGVEGLSPTCVPGEHFGDLQTEAFEPDGDFAVTDLPVHVEWRFEHREDFYVRPYQPEPAEQDARA